MAGEGRRAVIVVAALTELFLLAAFVTAGSFFSADPQIMSSDPIASNGRRRGGKPRRFNRDRNRQERPLRRTPFR
ncbi:MAG: hypothetical protein ACM3Z4_01035 [Hyphomicrobiales bacterium]